jgi:hypothetical protein
MGMGSLTLLASLVTSRTVDLIDATVADDLANTPKPRRASQTNTVSEDPDIERPMTRQQRRHLERLSAKGRGVMGGSRRA